VPALLAAQDVRLTVFAGNEGYESLSRELWAEEVELVRVPVSTTSRPLRALAEQALLPRAARKARLDLLHNTLNTAPALPGLPQITTIHDVIYKRFPETAGWLNAGVALLVPLAARRSQLVLTDSEASKRDLVELLGVDPARIAVTPLGPGLLEPEVPLEEEEVRRRLGLGGDAPVVLTVAAKRPHKNLGRLLDAFAQVDTNALLVVPGFETSYESELKERAGERMRFVGWLDDDTLDGLYRAATCLVLPSLAEGFGLPVLEAMARGTPVACSRASSLPEVAGDAVLYFDPLDTSDLAMALGQLLHDPDLRARLREAGVVHAAKFSWQRTAQATFEQYERVVASP
jgi:glycosyltransferase involved in cell wall biosynthesis